VAAGVRQTPEPIEPPPPPKSAQELLEEEVRRDWVHFRTAEVKRKIKQQGLQRDF